MVLHCEGDNKYTINCYILVSNEDRFCNICQEKGHFFIDCPKRNQLVDINLNATSVDNQKVRTINVNFQMI